MSRRAASAVDAFPLAVSGFRLEVAWHLLAVAGLRVGEALALRWADVDATAGLIYVRHAVFGVPYAALAVPRSIAGSRVVEAGPVLDVLSRHHRRQEAGRSEWAPTIATRASLSVELTGARSIPETCIARSSLS